MWRSKETRILELTYEEAHDLFARCLKSADDDNEESRIVLKKLARVIDSFLLQSQNQKAA